ncbi:MAG: DUF1207 domain-containing protein [Nitrospira sp.]|nr:DUF1207 domain-containing protein [Nitrospira sp.]
MATPPAGQLPDMAIITEIRLSTGKSRARNAWIMALALFGLLGLATETSAQITPEKENVRILDSGKTLRLLPRGDLYKPYIADPHRVNFSAQFLGIVHDDIDGAGNFRIGLKAGGRFGVLRLHPENRPELGWQVSFEAGIDTQFDIENSQDNIGWDGNFGWYLTTATEKGWSYKLAALHTSSHIGDEFIEDTGRKRINYTRREIALGISKQLTLYYRAYAELGLGYDPGNEDLQEPGRLQAGLEFEHPQSVWENLLGWYAALDLSSMQERDWKVDIAFQTGVSLPMKERMHRVGIEVYRGRPPLGEFFQDTEMQIVFGIWVDI